MAGALLNPPYRGSFLGQRKRRGGAPARGRPAARRGVRANAHDSCTPTPARSGTDLLPDYPNFNVDPLAARLAEHRALRIAIGEPAAEVAGFRTSHEEALRARQVAEIGAQPANSCSSTRRRPWPACSIDRRDAVRMWVQRTLGQLARDDQSIARLRKTLRVLLEGERELPRSRLADARTQQQWCSTVSARPRSSWGGPSRTDDSPSKLRSSPATNSRQRRRLRYLRPLNHCVEQRARKPSPP